MQSALRYRASDPSKPSRLRNRKELADARRLMKQVRHAHVIPALVRLREKFTTRESSFSFPASTSRMIPAAVNCLLIEPIW
jgi:ribosomal protein L39E